VDHPHVDVDAGDDGHGLDQLVEGNPVAESVAVAADLAPAASPVPS
jgi:hypothetical protein